MYHHEEWPNSANTIIISYVNRCLCRDKNMNEGKSADLRMALLFGQATRKYLQWFFIGIQHIDKD
jgi:hypothetical protein